MKGNKLLSIKLVERYYMPVSCRCSSDSDSGLSMTFRGEKTKAVFLLNSSVIGVKPGLIPRRQGGLQTSVSLPTYIVAVIGPPTFAAACKESVDPPSVRGTKCWESEVVRIVRARADERRGIHIFTIRSYSPLAGCGTIQCWMVLESSNVRAVPTPI